MNREVTREFTLANGKLFALFNLLDPKRMVFSANVVSNFNRNRQAELP